MTNDQLDFDLIPAPKRISRRLVIRGAVAGAGVAGLVPALDVLGASLPSMHDDHDHDDDKDDDDRRGSGGDDDDLAREDIDLPEGAAAVFIDDDDADGFSPGTLDIDAGQSVTFANLDDKPHTATGGNWDTGTLEPGDTATVEFAEPGSFPYSCQFHPVMTGTINVRPAEGTGAATPEGSPEASPASATPVAEGEGAVAIREFAFDPPEIRVSVGSQVTWTNEDQVPHTATAADGSFDTGTLDNGATASQVFDTAGTFDYVCAFHSSMQGTVIVE
jgi:plastocyanin